MNIRKMQTASGGPLKFTPKELKYLEWSKMTPELKREYRANRAKSHLLSGPSITNFWEAFQSYIGNRDPENPHLNTGEAPTPGMRNQAIHIVNKTPSIIKAYKKVVPKFIKKIKEFNGADKVLRTVSAASKLINPTYTKTLAKSPELVDLIPLLGFKDFNTKLLQSFLKVWETEAAKGPYSLKGLLQYDYSPDKIENLPKHFEEARKLQRGIDLGGRYGRLVSRKYQLMYNLIIDPTLKHIADTSPLYIPELFLLLKNFGEASEDFLKELIKRSNSYRRYMTKPGTTEDFRTFKGHGLVKGEGSQINVEGRMRSDFNGEYGSYSGYYEGHPNLKGDISTWWDQRIPLGVNVKLGIWTENPTIIKLRLKGHNYDPNSGSSAIELEFWKNYTGPRKFIDWPTHQVFFGTEGSQLLNFNVTTEMPKNFIFGKGYKQGGKMNILEFLKNGSGIHIKKKNRGKFTSYCGGKVTDECIRKAKSSGNPTLVKRATFALNARRWKHKEGGIIKAGFGLKLSNTVNKIGDFFNSNTGKGLLNLGMLAFGTIKGSIDANNYSSSFDAETNSLLKAMDASQRKNNYKLASQIATEIIKLKQLENPDIHYGPIDKLLLENQIANSLYDDSEMVKYQMLRTLEKLKLMEAIQGSSFGILDTVGGILNNFMGNKKDTSPNTSSNSSTFGNYVSTLFKNYGTFNSDGSMNMGQLGTWDINNGYKPKKIGTFMSNYT